MLPQFLVGALFCSTIYATSFSALANVEQRDQPSSTQCKRAAGPHEAAQKYGKYFGTATAVGQWGDEPYCDIISDTATFGLLTPAVGMKFDDVEPGNGWFDYSDADAIADRARDYGQLLRCHALIWPYQALPDWLTSRKWQRQELIDVMWRHITTVVWKYKGRCQAWDVVNEALLDDGSLRPSIFHEVIGPEYITIAFQAAAAADPTVPLYYNDYNIDNDWSIAAPVSTSSAAPKYKHDGNENDWYLRKRDTAYSRACGAPLVTNKIEGAKCLIKVIRAGGGKIDGVGLQGHFVYNATPSADKLARIMQGFADLNLDVAITELDIRMDLSNINELAINQQAQGYADVIAACRDTARCKGVTIWDIADKYSWVSSAIKGFGSAHMWDSQLVRKQKIWDAIMRTWERGSC